jgi:hypothetical protein
VNVPFYNLRLGQVALFPTRNNIKISPFQLVFGQYHFGQSAILSTCHFINHPKTLEGVGIFSVIVESFLPSIDANFRI